MAHSLIDPAVVEQRILALAQHGAYGETGVWRTVYSPEWVAATDLYTQWCREAGLTVARDPVGNVWGRLQGSGGGAAIVSGSHIDTQRPSGRYDGALGAIAALMAIEAVAARFGQPRRTLEAVVLCEEEGAGFRLRTFGGREPPPAQSLRAMRTKLSAVTTKRCPTRCARSGFSRSALARPQDTTSRASSNCISSKARCSNMQICPSPSSRALRVSVTTTPSSQASPTTQAPFRWT